MNRGSNELGKLCEKLQLRVNELEKENRKLRKKLDLIEKAAHGATRLCSAELAKELIDKMLCEQELQMELPDI